MITKKYAAEYNCWSHIKQRCLNPKSKFFHNYGGRGITICESWKDSFEQFLKDVGERPSNKHSLDRIDNNKGYYKENCRWATWQQQAENKRRVRLFLHKNEMKTIWRIAREEGISGKLLESRILILNMSVESALENQNIPIGAKILEYNGIKYTRTQLAKEVGIDPNTLWYRLNHGMTVEEAVRKRTSSKREAKI